MTQPRRGFHIGGHALSGADARRRPLSGRHADRQSRRHHVACAADACRRGPDRLRGHPRQPQAAGALRHRDGDHGLSRSQRRGRAPGPAQAHRRGCRGRADLRCRHAGDLRPGLQARARGARARPCGHRVARRLIGADRFGRVRIADRPLPVRGLPAAEDDAAARPDRGIVAHSRQSRAVRRRFAHCRDLVRPRGRIRRARSRDLPRTDQAARGGAARAVAGAGRALRGRCRDPRRIRHRDRAAR